MRAIDETTLDSVDPRPALELDKSDSDDSNAGGIELPAAEREEMTDDNDA